MPLLSLLLLSPSLLLMGPSGKGQSEGVQAINAWQMACTNTGGLLLVFVEQVLSFLPNEGGDVSIGTIARSTLTNLVGAHRVNLESYSICLHRLARVVALPTHPGGQTINVFKHFLIKLPWYILKFPIQCKKGRQTFVFFFCHVGRATAPGRYNDQIGYSYPKGKQLGLTRPGYIYYNKTKQKGYFLFQWRR